MFFFMSQISLALFCLHINDCFHGNIKEENIVFNPNNK